MSQMIIIIVILIVSCCSLVFAAVAGWFIFKKNQLMENGPNGKMMDNVPKHVTAHKNKQDHASHHNTEVMNVLVILPHNILIVIPTIAP